MPNGKQASRPSSPTSMLPPKTVFATEVNLTRVLDLSTDEIQRTLRTNSAELAQPWKARNRPVTQTLGLACFESGRFSALRYRSTKAAPSYCLAVFPSRMNPAEYVSVLDPQEFFSQIQLTKRKGDIAFSRLSEHLPTLSLGAYGLTAIDARHSPIKPWQSSLTTSLPPRPRPLRPWQHAI